jgi:cytoskeleton protein RodZ
MAKGNFGERLKRERELRDVTLEEITSATRIGPRFLEALENEDWEKLPGGVFNRGFVRSIARYLGLDEEALLGEYDLAHNSNVPASDGQPEQTTMPPPRWLPLAIIVGALVLLAAIILGGVYTWRHFAARRNAQQQPAATSPLLPQSRPGNPVLPTAAELPANSSNSAPTLLSGPLDLLISANAATHVLVVSDGRVVFYDEVHAGDNLHFPADNSFEVTASDAGALLLELNGHPMRPLGPPGSLGTMKLNRDDLRQAFGGNSKP